MGDLDVNGNVDNSAMPSYRRKSSSFDIRRQINQTESSLATTTQSEHTVTIGKQPAAWFEYTGAQTIKDMTGVATAVEGVNIKISPGGITSDTSGTSNLILYNYGVGITDGGTAGITQGDNVYDLFIMNGSVDGLLEQQVFIPVKDMSRVVLVALPNNISAGLETVATYANRLEINIR